MKYYATKKLLFIVPNPYSQIDDKTVVIPTKPKVIYVSAIYKNYIRPRIFRCESKVVNKIYEIFL
jgi:hypothetical protein